ncbi:MAG: hypothetical protein PF489_10050 [Salinivirgaceae bacterium]|nr:hypothetical protein [Salinivirgaceae bacterium]
MCVGLIHFGLAICMAAFMRGPSFSSDFTICGQMVSSLVWSGRLSESDSVPGCCAGSFPVSVAGAD